MFPQTTRRELLHRSTLGLSSVALAWLLNRDGLLATPPKPDLERQHFDLKPKAPHHPARAKAMIWLFMQGGPSHMDLLDPKPLLAKYDGKPFPGKIKYDNAAESSSKVLASPWKFAKHGQSGIEVSELLPHLAKVIDDVCVVRSMHTDVNNHEQSVHAMNTGRITAGHPSLGAWTCFGLGSESQNLPAYMALPEPRHPVGGVNLWTNGWLPSVFQGTVVRPNSPRILNLDSPEQLRGEPQEKLLKYLEAMNREHAADRPGESDLDARMASYELAAKMQTAAKEAMDISKESAETKKLYGIDQPASADYGTRCLIARRLVERGVRFVQVFTGYQTWLADGVQEDRPTDGCSRSRLETAGLAGFDTGSLGRRDGSVASNPE